jgi:hypothetical protein
LLWTFFLSYLRNFQSTVSVGRLVDFLPLGRIQFLFLLVGPTYPLRSVQTTNQARTRFFRLCGVFVYVLTASPGLKYTGSLTPYSLTASHNKTFTSTWSCK